MKIKRLYIEDPQGRSDKYVAESYVLNRGKARKRRDEEIKAKLKEIHKPYKLRDTHHD